MLFPLRLLRLSGAEFSVVGAILFRLANRLPSEEPIGQITLEAGEPLTASSDETRRFSYDGDVINYEVEAMGVAVTVPLERPYGLANPMETLAGGRARVRHAR